MSEREFKTSRYFAVKAKSEGRMRTGICSVFGHRDDWGDIVEYGAFTKTINEGRNRVKHLWNHDFSNLPTASIKELKEIPRDQLPPAVLEYAPDATGGLLVSREYHEDSFSDMVLKRIDAGDISEMSFGFNTVQYEERTEGEGESKIYTRILKEVSLYDTSDVLWGMNDATVAVKSARPIGMLLQELEIAIKAGRRNNESDQKMIEHLHEIAMDLGAKNCPGYVPEDDEKAKAAAVLDSNTALQANSLKLNRIRLNNLQLGVG